MSKGGANSRRGDGCTLPRSTGHDMIRSLHGGRLLSASGNRILSNRRQPPPTNLQL